MRIPRLTFFQLFILPISYLLFATTSSPAAGDWSIVRIKDQEYVTATNAATFYNMESFVRKGNDRLFQRPDINMKWTIGTQLIYVNEVKFNLSLPVVEYKGHALISTTDLVKLIDPVVRPNYISKSFDFDTVVIDPGHGGIDSGAKGRRGLEKDYNLDLSLRLKAELEKRGFRTVMTRSNDSFITLAQRVAIANAQRRAIFISIHYNSSGTRSASGVETFALAPQGTAPTHKDPKSALPSSLNGNAQDAANIALATAVHAHVILAFNPVDRGIKRGTFQVLRGINKPAILYEGGFLTNPTEEAKIHHPAYRQHTALTIATAIEKFKSVVAHR
ncbi:MAG: N-acetylmuramoyl-L-alanine amidase [Verrucomicrobiales bacterium]|nr:N-acetylmuramoyl-L-alanine amidase [Verrucomicrobiales bacterium]